jgi:hypothetical protein
MTPKRLLASMVVGLICMSLRVYVAHTSPPQFYMGLAHQTALYISMRWPPPRPLRIMTFLAAVRSRLISNAHE